MAERKRETLAVFDDAEEARVAQSMLDGAGIASFVEEGEPGERGADAPPAGSPAGGRRPAEGGSLHPDRPGADARPRLLVDAADLARARDFFVKGDPEDTPDDAESDDVARRAALRHHSDSTAVSHREESARRALYASITSFVLGALLVPAPPALLLLVPAGIAMLSLFLLVDIAFAKDPVRPPSAFGLPSDSTRGARPPPAPPFGIRARRMAWAALALDVALLALISLAVAHRRG